MIHRITLVAFALLFILTVYGEEAPDSRTKFQIKGDSVYFVDGRIVSIEDIKRDNPKLLEDSKEKKKVTKNENKEVEDGRIISSWKFYTIMLAFPVFLILLFILVFIRGRKKDK